MKVVTVAVLLCALGGTFARSASDTYERFLDDLDKCTKKYGYTDFDTLPKMSYLVFHGICWNKDRDLLNPDGTLNMNKVNIDIIDPIHPEYDPIVDEIVTKCNAAFVDRKSIKQSIEYVKCLKDNKIDKKAYYIDRYILKIFEFIDMTSS